MFIREISDHRSNFHVESNCPYCKICGKSKRELAIHLVRRHPQKNNENQLICPVCQETFKNIYALNVHIRSDHFLIQTYPCEKCGQVFKHSTKLYTHLQRCQLTDKKFHCDKCDAKFFTYASRSNHIIQKHTAPQFVCSTCGQEFKVKKRLDIHVKTKHENGPSVVCDTCGKVFDNDYYLQQHRRLIHNSISGKKEASAQTKRK